MMLVPDVVAVGTVNCPCGEYSCSIDLFRVACWPHRQVICPNCGLILEPLDDPAPSPPPESPSAPHSAF